MKPIRFVINDPIFKFVWRCHIGGTAQDAIDRYLKFFGEPKEVLQTRNRMGIFYARANCGKGGVIWIREKSEVILSHEIYHAIGWMYDLMEIPQRSETDELGAYYTDWLTEKFLARF